MSIQDQNEMTAAPFGASMAAEVNTHLIGSRALRTSRRRVQKLYKRLFPGYKCKKLTDLPVNRTLRLEGLAEELLKTQSMATRFADNLEVCAEWARKAEGLLDVIGDSVAFGDNASLGKNIVSRLEGALIAYMALATSSSYANGAFIIALYAKTWTKSHSATGWIVERMQDLWSKMQEPKGGVKLKPEGWFSENLDMITDGALGEHIAEMLNLLILTGVMPDQSDTSSVFTKETHALFKVPQRRLKCSSVLRLFIGCCDWIFSNVIPAIATGEYAMLLSSDETLVLDVNYRKAIHMLTLLKGNVIKELTGKYKVTTDAEVLNFAQQSIEEHETTHKLAGKNYALRHMCNVRIDRLQKMVTDIQAMWKDKPIRPEPLGVLLTGESGVNKTGLVHIGNHVVSQACNFPEGKEYVCMLNSSDEYQSEFNSRVLTVGFDDLCNTRAEREQRSPLHLLIQFINNVHCCALSPIAELKGKNDIRVKQVYVTTNDETLSASYWTVNTSSIFRRFNFIIDVQLKPDAILPSGEIDPKNLSFRMPDMWILHIKRVKLIRGGKKKDQWEYETVIENGSVMDYVNLLADEAPKWFAKQDQVVENATDLHKAEHCKLHPRFIVEKETGCLACNKERACMEAIDAATRVGLLPEGGEGKPEWVTLTDDVLEKMKPIDGRCPLYFEEEQPDEDPLMEGFEKLPATRRFDAIAALPIEPLSDALSGWKAVMVKNAGPLLAVSLALGAAFATYSLLTNTFDKLNGEGALLEFNKTAAPPKAIANKDNAWKKVYSNLRDYPLASTTSTITSVETKIDKNLSVARIWPINPLTREKLGDFHTFNICPLKHTMWVAPAHEFEEDVVYLIEVRTAPKGTLGVKFFQDIVDSASLKTNRQKNVAVLNLQRGGDVANMWKFLPNKPMGEVNDPIRRYYRDVWSVEEGKEYCDVLNGVVSSRINNCGPVHTLVGDFDGFEYSVKSEDGNCGAMLWLGHKYLTWIGMHIAGNQKDVGGAIWVYKELFEDLMFDTIKVTETTGYTPYAQCKEVPMMDQIHTHNPMHYIDDERCLEIMGSHNLPRSKFRTAVRDSCIRERVEAELGPCEHTAPLRKCATPARRQDLLDVSEPLPPPLPCILQCATDDFKSKIDRFLEVNTEFLDFCHAIDMHTAVNGVPGVPGFDSVNPKTSMSHPWNCPKMKLFVVDELALALGIDSRKILVKNEDGQYSYEFVFDKEKFDLDASVESLMLTMLNGERANVVFKTNIKDEAVKYSKLADNRLRIFSGAQFDFVVLTRMVTLPTITAMTYYPEVFESAVGANATGKDWEYLQNIIGKFGKNRCFAGDFKKFDKKTRSGFLLGAFDILKHILKKAGMGEKLVERSDGSKVSFLDLIDGIATECSMPIYDFEGVIAKVLGSGPSGHALTVVINGLVNGLGLRYCYYFLHYERLSPRIPVVGEDIPLFHERVSAVTYGDDNGGSVSISETLFNQVEASRVFATFGMEFTRADKLDIQEPFTNFEDLDFLKRKFVKVEGFSQTVSQLDFSSIKKMLCITQITDPAISEAQNLGSSIMSARSEMAFYGREALAQFDQQLLRILDGQTDANGYVIKDFVTWFPFEHFVERFENTRTIYGQNPLPPCMRVPLHIEGARQSLPRPEDDDSDFEPIWYDYRSGADGYGLQTFRPELGMCILERWVRRMPDHHYFLEDWMGDCCQDAIDQIIRAEEDPDVRLLPGQIFGGGLRALDRNLPGFFAGPYFRMCAIQEGIEVAAINHRFRRNKRKAVAVELDFMHHFLHGNVQIRCFCAHTIRTALLRLKLSRVAPIGLPELDSLVIEYAYGLSLSEDRKIDSDNLPWDALSKFGLSPNEIKYLRGLELTDTYTVQDLPNYDPLNVLIAVLFRTDLLTSSFAHIDTFEQFPISHLRYLAEPHHVSIAGRITMVKYDLPLTPVQILWQSRLLASFGLPVHDATKMMLSLHMELGDMETHLWPMFGVEAPT